MQQNEITTKIKSIIAEQIGINESEIEENLFLFDDLAIDSLDSIELMMTMEEEFGIDIPDEDMQKIETVSETIKYIENKLKEKNQDVR